MASRTVQAARAYDHLYDPNYTVSGAADHGRADMRASFAGATVAPAPVYDNMFSDNQSYPRTMYQMKGKDAVPPTVDRGFRPPGADRAMLRSQSHPANVQGGNRPKYFKRPVVPYMRSVDPSVLLRTTQTADPLFPPIKTKTTPRTRTVGTMSDYRESEAQTDPYTPEYTIVGDNPNPELLTLASFSHGHGLPANLAEVEMIEKAREKRAWEASLPPLEDSSRLHIRQAMMEEMEMREWKEREDEIRKLQDTRLEMLRKVIETREAENEEINDARVKRVWEEKMTKKQEKIDKIERNRIKALRKLANQRTGANGKVSTKRDFIAEYADFGSKVYAPKTMDGVFTDKMAGQNEPASINTRNLRVLDGIMRAIPPNKMETRAAPPRRMKAVGLTPEERHAKKIQRHLAVVDDALKAKKSKTKERRPALRCARKVEKPPPRPPTPEVEPPDIEEENRHIAATLLQRLVRGRAEQAIMLEGKENRLPLIQELRMLYAVSPEERAEIQEKREQVIAKRKERLEAAEKQALIDSTVESIQGEIIGETLDTLTKELLRLREERKINAMATLARHERVERETAESEHRKKEEGRRREEEEIYRQIMRTHRSTVSSYLGTLMTEAIDQTASRQAMDEARLKAQKLNTIVNQLERSRDSPQTIVKDLVGSFLFPEVDRRSSRSQMELDEKKFLMAADATVAEIKEEDLILEPVGGKDAA